MGANRNHKDSVFSLLFSNPTELRALYSAIEGVQLPPDIPIEINTLTDVLYKDQINDISFTIDNRLVCLFEQQSTINNNLPFRFYRYSGEIYKRIITHKMMYRSKQEKIPMPEFIALYNGNEPFPEHKELRLSDAFKGVEDLKASGFKEFPLELVVQVYNINHGHNAKILERSKSLYGYSFFINKIKEYRKEGKTLEESINLAIIYCTEKDILGEFLMKNGSEVFDVLFNWNQEEAMEVWREEFREDCREQLHKEISEQLHKEIREELSIELNEKLREELSIELNEKLREELNKELREEYQAMIADNKAEIARLRAELGK